MEPVEPETAGIIERLFQAGKMEAPIFHEGEELEIRNARFRVVAIDRRLMVLEGIPSRES